MKILIINSDWSVDMLKRYGISHLLITIKKNKFVRIIHALDRKFKIFPKRFWDKKEWWKSCEGYDLIILLDSTKDTAYQSKIIENNVSSNTRLVFYLQNPVSFTPDLNLISSRWEKWSFSRKESTENGFMYAETFYFKEFVDSRYNPKIVYDSFFVGLDKGRMTYLKELKTIFDIQNLITLFYIVDNFKALYNRDYKLRLSYREVIKLVKSSKSIIDVVQEKQEGMTLRVMESIFFKKKLITNNAAIKNRTIYSPKNIFVLGEDDIANLFHFINEPYIDIDFELVKKYEFESWLQRIISNVEFN